MDKGTSQHRGNNQHSHLVIKNLVITSDKPYPNITEKEKEIYCKSQWKVHEVI